MRASLKPMTAGFGVAAVLGALVIAAHIWPRSSATVPAVASTPRPSPSAGGPILDLIIHSWQRPSPVTPGQDQWGSGFLRIATDVLDYGREPGPAASRSAVSIADVDLLDVTAIGQTRECAIGDVGTYRWAVEGKDTVMILTALGADACAVRETALAGTWVRSDLPAPADAETQLIPGTHLTSAFDPFGEPGVTGQLSYTVPEGWALIEDFAGDVVLRHHSDAAAGPSTVGSQSATDTFITLLAEPRISAVKDGAACGVASDGPPVGRVADAIAAAVVALDGVETSAPMAVTIDGYRGQILDLKVAPAWTGGCRAPDGQIAAVPFLLRGRGTGPTLGISPGRPLRLILLDLTGGRTTAVGIFGVTPDEPPPLDEPVAVAMPVVEGFQFRRH